MQKPRYVSGGGEPHLNRSKGLFPRTKSNACPLCASAIPQRASDLIEVCSVCCRNERINKTRPSARTNQPLLWMYCREIASFDTPTFSKKLGEIIARATSTPQTG